MGHGQQGVRARRTGRRGPRDRAGHSHQRSDLDPSGQARNRSRQRDERRRRHRFRDRGLLPHGRNGRPPRRRAGLQREAQAAVRGKVAILSFEQVTTCGSLLELDVHGLDHRGPQVDLRPHGGGERVGGAADGPARHRLHAGLEIVRRGDLARGGLELLHDRRRRARRGEEAEPGAGDYVRHADLGQRRYVGQFGNAGRGGDRQGAQVARADLRHDGRSLDEGEGGLVAQQAGRRLVAAAVEDRGRGRTGLDLEIFDRQREHRGGCGVIGLVRIGLQPGDQLRDAVRRMRFVDHHHHRVVRDLRDRDEIPHDVVGQAVPDRSADRHRAGRGAQERVAIGRRLRDRVWREPPARARFVLDQECAAELCLQPLRDDARDRIGAAAGAEADDDADCVCGIAIGFVGVRRRGGAGE